MMELGLVENLQREDLNPVDEARAYRALTEECGLTQEEVARKVGKDRTTVANMMRLLKLPKELQGCLYDGSLSTGHARALLAVDDPRIQLGLCRRIVAEQLSVRRAEELVKRHGRPPRRPPAGKQKPPSYLLVEEELRRILGTKVTVEKGRRKGRIEIEFYSEDDLERILQLFSRGEPPEGS
jgi:ParB family chromosome partitioning protein